MNDIVPFHYGAHEVRTVEIDGEPWFVAADVCTILDIGRVHDAVRGLDDDEKGADTIRTPGGDQQVTIVNEPGLYSLILRSRKPEAKAFKRWITHEVLPAIRRTGSYSVAPTSQLDILRAAIDQIEAAQLAAQRAELVAEHAAETVREVGHRVDALEGNHGWYSALAYARRRNWATSVDFLNPLGRRAGQIGRAAGLRAAKVPHPIYGEANAWPEWVWDQAYQDGAGGAA
ncbi:Bro-N domain-containing protein [Pseudonocardia hispaniensis]|uniref:Bro-N domain-containing protein n=1 Tax=Pseudonocardia hispaniensis TaxID=904933 RepID=A0ABW1J7R5_9PSEU